MNLIYTVLVALPLGYVLVSRSTAVLAYLVVGSWVFAFQTASLLLEWLSGSGRSAFGPFPTELPASYDSGQFWGYGAVNLVICLAGVGLVVLGGRLRARREARQAQVALV